MSTKKALAKTVRKRLERLAADLPAVKGFNDAYDVLKSEAQAVEAVITDWPIERTKLSCDYKVTTVDGVLTVIAHRTTNDVVAVFSAGRKTAIDFFTDILGT